MASEIQLIAGRSDLDDQEPAVRQPLGSLVLLLLQVTQTHDKLKHDAL
jgi:hypothetical protein